MKNHIIRGRLGRITDMGWSLVQSITYVEWSVVALKTVVNFIHENIQKCHQLNSITIITQNSNCDWSYTAEVVVRNYSVWARQQNASRLSRSQIVVQCSNPCLFLYQISCRASEADTMCTVCLTLSQGFIFYYELHRTRNTATRHANVDFGHARPAGSSEAPGAL